MAIHTILGANGTIANALLPILKENNHSIRLASRNPKTIIGVENIKADVLNYNEVLSAANGSDIVYLLVGIQYNAKIWARDWPQIIANVINACKTTGAKLVFFDNAYMYGKVEGNITEETPYNPSSKKGAVRAKVAKTIHEEVTRNNFQAIIARAADFYGPEVTEKSAPGLLVFMNLKKKKKAQWMINPHVPRTFNYVPDAAKALYLLATTDEAYGQVWHLPTAPKALSGNEFVREAAKHIGTTDKMFVLPKWLLKTLGLFNPFINEMNELNYQDEYPFEFDSSKFNKAFHFKPTSYEEGIKKTAQWFKENSA
ncbi:NAD-dependent epimerase/dehydratase family protein [Albibacterium profundi]|uniref:NAD-dependent epimerase/dehydratase family protein n=1 Tax=Albibacterium profundi TaxID=3134906 RepID=A0ABV5CBK7_9SPHI